MVKITPGTNTTVPTDTAEGVVFWALLALVTFENSPVTNPDKVTAVQGSLNVKDFTFNITFNFPCIQGLDGAGRVVFTAVNYLKNVTFEIGNPPGTFKSNNVPAYAVEAIMHLQNLENNKDLNPRDINNITATYDSEKQVLTGTAKIPCDIYLDANNGTGKFDPKEYLV